MAILTAIAIPVYTGITHEAEAKVNVTNARSIATVINAHNSLDADNAITEINASRKGWKALSKSLGVLCPTGLSNESAVSAMTLITISNKDATVANDSDSK